MSKEIFECRFCGQTHLDATDHDEAILLCDCNDAVRFRNQNECFENAKLKIDELFGYKMPSRSHVASVSNETVEVLYKLAHAIVFEKIESATLKIDMRTKAILKADGIYNVKIKRENKEVYEEISDIK